MAKVPMGVMLEMPSGTFKTLMMDNVGWLEDIIAHMMPELSMFLACIRLPGPAHQIRLCPGAVLLHRALNLDPIQDFHATPEKHRPEQPVKLGERSFRFEKVSFSYDGKKEVLHDVSFTAPTGQITTIVGPSGSGKSTIAKLMAGFWDATGRTVSFGGQNIPFDQLMREISYVAQDNFLFDRSIRENICMGDPSATDAEVEAAARAMMKSK